VTKGRRRYTSSVHVDGLYRQTDKWVTSSFLSTPRAARCVRRRIRSLVGVPCRARLLPCLPSVLPVTLSIMYVGLGRRLNDEQPCEASHYRLILPKFRRRLTSSSMGPRTRLLSEDDGDYPRGNERAVGRRQAVIGARVCRQWKDTPGRARVLISCHHLAAKTPSISWAHVRNASLDGLVYL
jgi:hypothetical protein